MFAETASGAKTDRRQLAKVLEALTPGDVLMVTRWIGLPVNPRPVERAGKGGRGKGCFPLPWRRMGRQPRPRTAGLMLTVIGGLAEFERELIRTRTGEGRTRAKARARALGGSTSSPPTSGRKLGHGKRPEKVSGRLPGATT